MEREKAVIILSGGLDSTTLLYDVFSQGFKVYPLSFNYGQKHKKELNGAIKSCKRLGLEHKVVDLSALNEVAPSALTRNDWKIPEGHYADKNMKQTVVPNRNMVMLSIAGAYAMGMKAKYLFYGAHAGDHEIYPDCRPEFVEAMNKAISLADWNKVQLLAPYSEMNKGDIVRRGVGIGVDYNDTWTCYKGEELACGKCGSCTERLEAFKSNGIIDPVKYSL